MSEELLQRDLLKNPDKIGKWSFYNIGATNIKALKKNKIIPNYDYRDIDNKKPDGLIVYGNEVLALIENKKPSEFNTEKKRNKAILQALEISTVIKAKVVIVTDTETTFWLNGITGEPILNEDNNPLRVKFDPNNDNMVKLFTKISDSITENNSSLVPLKLQNPTPLAEQIWQDIWAVSGATPENCLYTFVEIFIFKYLSDLSVLRGLHSFDNLLNMYDVNTEEEVLEYYVSTIRPKIKELFPKNKKDNTTIVNGTIFVSKDDKAIEGYSGVFKKILIKFRNYGKLEKIDYDFKSKLFESFLKESISKKNWGQFFTPLKVVKPMVKMADIQEGMSICDPACGVGKFLLEAVLPNLKNYYIVKADGTIESKITIHGYDKGFDREEQKTIILAKANMMIYFSDLIKENVNFTKEFAKLFNESFTLKTNSILGTLRDPVIEEFDLILTNPPYVTSGSSNLKDEIRKDTKLEKHYQANGLGIEALFMEWIVKALKKNGKAFIVIPDGILNRQNDANLRKFIMENCIIDTIISLPLNTFFTTNKKTFIIGLTKKYDISKTQESPVFTYLVSDIGETLDINRFETGNNQLETAVSLFNQFKGSKEFFTTTDKRCKIFPFSEFADSYADSWIIDKWWPNEEKIELGILEKPKFMTIDEFGIYIGEIADEISEYKSIFQSIDNEKKNIEVNWVDYSVSQLFDIQRGHSKYTKKYGNSNNGPYPVYSASNYKELTYINTYDYDGKYLTWSTNGFAGYMKVIEGKFSINGDRGILIPKNDGVNIEFIKIVLEPILREMAKGRKGEKGKDEFTKLYPSMIEKIKIKMPVDIETGTFSNEYQTHLIRRNSIVNDFKKMVLEKKLDLTKIKIRLRMDSEVKQVKVTEIFDIVKGKAKYTNKYFKDHPGEYPVYSSQTANNGIISFIDTYDYDDRCITWTTDGVHAGTVFLRDGKFSMTTHCGALFLKEEYKNTINVNYVYSFLFNHLKSKTKGEQNKRVTVNIMENLTLEIPIEPDSSISLEKQRIISNEFIKIETTKKEIIKKLNLLLDINIHF